VKDTKEIRGTATYLRPMLKAQSMQDLNRALALFNSTEGQEKSIGQFLAPCLQAYEEMLKELDDPSSPLHRTEQSQIINEFKVRAVRHSLNASVVSFNNNDKIAVMKCSWDDTDNIPTPPHHDWGATQGLIEIYARIIESVLNQPPETGEKLKKTRTSVNPISTEAVPAASCSVVWGGSNILAQRSALPWELDEFNKLRYLKPIEGGKGHAAFWVTGDRKGCSAETLTGDAARAVIQGFDVRAAIMHLIYSAYALSLPEPWKDEFVIDGRQIYDILGFNRRSDLTRQQKLALIRDIALQPSQIMTYIHYFKNPDSKGFTIREARLWEISIDSDFKENSDGSSEEITGLSIIGRAGPWAEKFLNRQAENKAFFQYGFISDKMLRSIGSLHQKHPGAVRMIIWLIYKTRVGPGQNITVRQLMEVAYESEKLSQAENNCKKRGRLANTWDGDLEALTKVGWILDFDDTSYPVELRPIIFGGGIGRTAVRPTHFWGRLGAAKLVIHPPEEIAQKIQLVAARKNQHRKGGNVAAKAAIKSDIFSFSKEQIKEARIARGMSRSKFAAAVGKSEDWVKKIEIGKRRLTSENVPLVGEVLGISPLPIKKG